MPLDGSARAPGSVLVVGGGAREHALAWRLARESGIDRVIVAPGNPGMSGVAETRPELHAADTAALVSLAVEEAVDLVVVGPEGPLVSGLADALRDAAVPVFGPEARAAEIEGSKAFCRSIATAAAIPMAHGEVFSELRAATRFARELGAPLVVKADGLAGGKGVTVCDSLAEAEDALREALIEDRFAEAGSTVVVERALTGREASLIAICDSTTAVALPAARDHKRLGDGDTGPNTGGMGAYSPVEELDDAACGQLLRTIHAPALRALARAGRPFRGALYAGVMLTDEGPVLLEFNARFGDPETQSILPRLDAPLGALMLAAAQDRLGEALAAMGIDGPMLPTTQRAAAAVVLAARGYPGTPQTGGRIEGLEEARASGALVFCGGVEGGGDDLRTAGGRVLTVVARGEDVSVAARSAYAAADRVSFPGLVLRSDIGLAGHAKMERGSARDPVPAGLAS